MKKITQYLYIGLFLLMIGAGFVLNFGNLSEATKEAVEEYDYDAWSIIIENRFNDSFWNRYGFIEVNGTVHKLLGQRQMNGMVKLNNGKLVSTVEYRDVSYSAQNVIDFYAKLEEMNVPYIYIQAPYDFCKYDSQLPEGIEDYSNYNADVFLQLLSENNVPNMDLRECLHESGMNHYESFYMTDHHWTIETSFWAYTEVVNCISDILGEAPDSKYLDMGNYTKTTLADAVLGSNGRKTGIVYAGLDDITMLVPNFETQVDLSVPEKDLYRQGDFEDAFMFYERLDGNNLYEMLQYNVYMGQDYACAVQTCQNAPVDANILLIKDSFARPVSAFMGTVYSEVHCIDMRYYEGNIEEYIQSNDIDIVVMMYNPYMLTNEGAYKFE
ncbi:MAG: hypothetical protein IJ336_00915 [Lachnospiraceae bacterium]|nr:hypothetical protein [Lachnospiraceae bacterium]